MKNIINSNDLQITLEVMKLANLEAILKMDDGNTEISDDTILEVLTSIENQLLYLLRRDGGPNAPVIFANTCKSFLKSDKFLGIAQSILDKRYSDYCIEENNRITEETPEPILKVMQHLAADGNKLNDLLSRNFHSQHFLSQLMIYKMAEDKFEIDSEEISKTELYRMVYGGQSEKIGIKEKMYNIQEKEKYKVLLTGDAGNDVSLKTATKRMHEVIPSKYRDDTLDQSRKLNVYSQYALLIEFLIYKTRYRLFLSNPITKKVPDYYDVQKTKEMIEELLKAMPISGVDDTLFLKTISEDTYHFALFNAMTRLTVSVLQAMEEIMVAAKDRDSLSMLFVLDQMIESTPVFTREWLEKYMDMVFELEKFSRNPEIQQAVSDAVTDEQSLSYAKQNMMDMFKKYDDIIYNSENPEFEDKLFKKIVKDFYNSDGEGTAYSK